MHLKITAGRSSKFGDFRPKQRDKPARISVNNDLNKFHFLITLVHEIAHAANWEKHQRKVNPHGREWQEIYRQKMTEMVRLHIFPSELIHALQEHLQNVKASTCSDVKLYKMLRIFDEENDFILLSELEENKAFELKNGRQLIKGKKRRTRYLCKELNSNRNYLVSAHAEVLALH